jgi:hypothetical protein
MASLASPALSVSLARRVIVVPRVSTAVVVSLVNLQLAHPLASLVSKERTVSRVRSVPTAWMALVERLVLLATRE